MSARARDDRAWHRASRPQRATPSGADRERAAMSVTAVAGLRGGWAGVGHQAVGRARPRDRRDRRPARRSPPPACSPRNLVAAAPVQISREHLADGHAAAVVLSSGNANAATGSRAGPTRAGWPSSPARALGCATTDVLVCSTGLIGIPMPMAPVESGIPKLARAAHRRRRRRRRGGRRDAHHRHGAQGERQPTELGAGAPATVGGMAKGAAMLAPAMATMLAVVTTDVAVAPDALLQRAAPARVDDTSTSCRRRVHEHQRHRPRARQRRAGNELITDDGGPASRASATRSTAVCADLAEQMARDAEGATKLRPHHRARRPLATTRRGSAARTVAAASSCSARSTARTPTGAGSSPSWA